MPPARSRGNRPTGSYAAEAFSEASRRSMGPAPAIQDSDPPRQLLDGIAALTWEGARYSMGTKMVRSRLGPPDPADPDFAVHAAWLARLRRMRSSRRIAG